MNQRKMEEALRAYDQEQRELLSISTASVNDEPSKTLQGPALEADINYIVKTYGLNTTQVPPEVYDPRYYGDLSDVPDLQTALNRVREAEEHFMKLPPELRARFHDSPGVLWDFVNDPRNGEEAVRLGLLKQIVPEASSAQTPEAGTKSAPV